MNKNILVVAAHPDDEVLGCGGYIAKYSSKGYQVHGVILAEGITSRSNSKNLNISYIYKGLPKKFIFPKFRIFYFRLAVWFYTLKDKFNF